MRTTAELEAFLKANPSPVDVEVGRFYMVPCIRHNYGVRRSDPSRFAWIPVIGPVHDDTDVIGFRPLHLHRDTRFDATRLSIVTNGLTRLAKVEVVEDSRGDSTEVEFALKRRKCRRQADCWTPVRFTKPLEEHYSRCRIGADGLCPHRGIPVALGHRLPDGSMVCAGHGLRWSQDGELLPLEVADVLPLEERP